MLETSHGQSNETAYVIQLYMDTVHEKKRDARFVKIVLMKSNIAIIHFIIFHKVCIK